MSYFLANMIASGGEPELPLWDLAHPNMIFAQTSNDADITGSTYADLSTATPALDGTISATGVTSTTGLNGEARNFNGSTGEISMPFALAAVGTGTHTFVALVKDVPDTVVPGVSSQTYIYAAGRTGNNQMINFTSVGSLFEGNGSQTATCAPGYTNDGQWHVLAAEFSIENLRVKTWLDGTFQNQVAANADNTALNPGTYSHIGVYKDQDNTTAVESNLSGKVDDFFAYDRGLSDAEHLALANHLLGI